MPSLVAPSEPTAYQQNEAETQSCCCQCHDESRAKNAEEKASPSQQSPSKHHHLEETDSPTVHLYFRYYSRLANQMNMLQDAERTNLYRKAITQNPSHFVNKVVLDVGAGSGILSYFACEAGAAHVFAVEASSVADVIETLADQNPHIGNRVSVLRKMVEHVSLTDLRVPSNDFLYATSSPSPDPMTKEDTRVDTLVSEPLGTFLFNERMIESYLFARDHLLKPGGAMYPNRARLFLCLFSDAQLYSELLNKTSQWRNEDLYGVNVSCLAGKALEETFEQPILDYIDPSILITPAQCIDFDLRTIDRKQLESMVFPIDVLITTATLVHGVAGWFQVNFDGPETQVTLSTGPWSPPTHWHQLRFMIKEPLAVNPGQRVVGSLVMNAHKQQSYNLKIHLAIANTNIWSESALIDLKDPDYRWYSNTNSMGCATGSMSVPGGEAVGTPTNSYMVTQTFS
eukprot:Gregarina_sp_Pseudo_9__3267@NODE_344_length_3099_cov_184_964379_g324_i0_p2_GENE_NODE_344_length_3099_cov_184_964379_g324_i0NODE_344_length_3099_cov_184_964379_g324_i0_p2_ORF_typecomplete_len470_score29_85PrmA/PF06325_13/4_7e14PRMT5/PF05185_16/8_9e08Methyltransf_16/PF10294_9/8_4e06Cons_hypoth95/PF03602_15/1_8e05Methyltransf_25/PF13649_6/4_1e05MTS/PF05175_14/9_4e05PRMT5_C/PF17286_2/6e03PRMT5_C/PF17286_2/5e05Methyltransf_23/PF13489_6/0_00044Methyltransf_9/PF08003_11/0_0019Methyltransf_31/PF13847_6/